MAIQLTDIVESSQPERLATGFVFTEGPVWHPEGYWLFVDVRASLIYRLVPGGQPEIFRAQSGGSNGMTFDLQGRLLICEGDNRQVTRREPDGTYTPLAQRLGGKRINRPNNIVTRSDGSIYFTDPGGRLPQEARELGFNGVHRIAPDGTLSNATADTEYPNGLALSPDERVLYVAITRRDDGCIEEKARGEVCTHQCIRAFDVAADGTLTNATADTEYPNGIAFSPDERVLYVAITRRDDGCIAEKARGEVCTHQCIRAFDVAADGTLSNNRIFATLASAAKLRAKVEASK